MAFLPRESKIELNVPITYGFYNFATHKFEYRRKYKDLETKERLVHRISIKLLEDDHKAYEDIMSNEFATLGNLLVDLALMYISNHKEYDVKKIIRSDQKMSWKNQNYKQTSAGLTERQWAPILKLHKDTGIWESTIVRILAKEQLKLMSDVERKS